jgi:hypothetical protein
MWIFVLWKKIHVELFLSFKLVKNYLYINKTFDFYNHCQQYKKEIDRDNENRILKNKLFIIIKCDY